jgi:hypothetical protein
MMEAGLVGITRFSSKEDIQPVVLTVRSKGVLEFRTKVEDALEAVGIKDGSEYSYNPHVTLGYIPQDEELPRLVANWAGMDIIIDRVRVGFGGETMDYLLGQWEDGHEEKARHVRTADGVRHFNLPIGAVIGSDKPDPQLGLDLGIPDPRMTMEPADRARLEEPTSGRNIKPRYDQLERDFEHVTEEMWSSEERSPEDQAALRAAGKRLIDAGFDYQEGRGSIAGTIAEGSWTYYAECRAIRQAAYEMLNFKINTHTNEQDGPSRSDPHLGRGVLDGGGVSQIDPDLFAYGLLRGLVNEYEKPPFPLYRGITHPDPEEFVRRLKEGDTFNMPLASFSDNRKHTERFGTDVTFVLASGARSINGGSMGPDPDLEEGDPGYWDWQDETDTNREWISGGRFRVGRVISRTVDGKTQVTVMLTQVGVFDPDTGMLEKKADQNLEVPWFSPYFDQPLAMPKDKPEKKDIANSSGNHQIGIGVGTRLAKKKTVSRNKHPRLPLKARAKLVANSTVTRSLKMRAQTLIETKAKVAKDGDGDGFIYDGTARQRPAPIGTPIVGQITYAGASDYDGYGLVKDKKGNEYIVGKDDGEPGFVALVNNPDDPWGDIVVQHARTKTELFKLLDQATRNGRKPNAAPLEGGHHSKPTKIKNPTLTADENQHLAPTKKRPPRTPGTRKRAATRKPSKKAAASKKRGGPSLAKVLSTSGGNREPQDKDGVEQIGHLDPQSGKVIAKPKDKAGVKRVKRDDPKDYLMKNGKPVQSEELRIKAHLAATGDAGKRSVELARERGQEFRLAPARDNEHLWFPKDPNSPVAYSFRQQEYMLDKNGDPVSKIVGGKKVQQFVPGSFGPRVPVYKKEYMESNQGLKDERIINIARHMPLLDRAILRDWKKSDTAASVAMMRVLGIRPNTMGEEAQSKNLSKKSPLKARALRAQGIDPDQPIFGATSLRKKHVQIVDGKVIIDFIGKEHVRNTHVTEDPTILAIVKDRLKKKGGPETPLFETDANATRAYIRKSLGSSNVTNKDLRSYVATEIAGREIARRPAPKNEAEFRMAQAEIAALVAQTLNNVARQALGSYIASPVWDEWKDGITK